jgi:hypothetical protein
VTHNNARKFKKNQSRQEPGSVLNSGARLYEPQHIPMQSKPLQVADPRSENKSGHYQEFGSAPGNRVFTLYALRLAFCVYFQ